MIRDCFVWREAVKKAKVDDFEMSAINVLIYAYGRDYIKKMDFKSLAEMIYEIRKIKGESISLLDAEEEVEAWYNTVK